jgi:hypothetical protein
MEKSTEQNKKNTKDVETYEHRCFDSEWVEKQYQKYLKAKVIGEKVSKTGIET